MPQTALILVLLDRYEDEPPENDLLRDRRSRAVSLLRATCRDHGFTTLEDLADRERVRALLEPEYQGEAIGDLLNLVTELVRIEESMRVS